MALGFPAFDCENRLVGLYREFKSASNATSIVFVSAHEAESGEVSSGILDLDAGLEDGDAELAERALAEEIESQSDSIHRLANIGSHDRLKESAAIYHWSKEPFSTQPEPASLSS